VPLLAGKMSKSFKTGVTGSVLVEGKDLSSMCIEALDFQKILFAFSKPSKSLFNYHFEKHFTT
jgi:hypothetical protein